MIRRGTVGAVLLATLTMCGCGSPAVKSVRDSSGAPVVLDLRAVVSSHQGACAAPPLTDAPGGSACAIDGRTKYDVGASLGHVTVATASIAIDPMLNEEVVNVQVAVADTKTLAGVSTQLLDKKLGILITGRVVMAATVQSPLDEGRLQIVSSTPDALQQVASALHLQVPPSTSSGSDDGPDLSGIDAAAQTKLCKAVGRRLVPAMAHETIWNQPMLPADAARLAAQTGDAPGAQMWMRQPSSDVVYLCNFATPRPVSSPLVIPSCPPGQDPAVSDVGPARSFLVDTHGHSSELKGGGLLSDETCIPAPPG